MAELLTIEIAYGSREGQWLISQRCCPGTTLATLLDQAKLEQAIPGLKWREHAIGIYSRLTSPDTLLSEDCRIEIYQPLSFDPKQARLNRALKNPLVKAKAKNRVSD